MNFSKLKEVLDKNNIPYDVKLLSDSGWECDETEIGSVFYNKEENAIVCRQPFEIEVEKVYNNKTYKCIYAEQLYLGNKNENNNNNNT